MIGMTPRYEMLAPKKETAPITKQQMWWPLAFPWTVPTEIQKNC